MSRVDTQARQKAEAILRGNLSPRYWKLDRLERYADGSQYEGRPSFWNDDVPLQERGPCIVHPVVGSAIASNCDLVLGDGRYPTSTTHPGEDDSAFDDRFGLSEDDSAILDRFLCEVQEQTRAQSVFTELLETAQHSKTAVAICRVVDGKLDIETTLAKWCTPTFNPKRPSEVTKLEIRYPYIEEYFDEERKQWSCRCLLYRRVIDATSDTVFLPAMASEHGEEPDSWTVDAEKSSAHNLGFCPVRWYKFMPRKSTVAELDGNAIHEKLTDEIDALNFSLSQTHRACLYCADPQMVETGVDEDHNPAPMGRTATLWVPGDPLENKQWRGPSRDVGGMPARKKGPGVVYRYPNENSKVDYLTLPGDAMKPGEDNARRLESTIKEALAYVAIDLDKMKLGSDVSGRALEWLHRKQIDRCTRIRADFGDNCLKPILGMLLRIALTVGDGLYIAGLDKVRPIIKRFLQDVQNVGARWFDPPIKLMWGPWFPLTAADAKVNSETVRADYQAGIISRQTAVEKLAPFYGIADAAAYVESLEAESEDREEAVRALQSAAGKGATAPEPEEEDDAREALSQVKPVAKKAPAKKPREAAPVMPLRRRTKTESA